MSRFSQGTFYPTNPNKYIGKGEIFYRSSWELTIMNKCDQHPDIINWASESIKIPYQDPFTGKRRTYIPDFFILFRDINGNKRGEILEVKPIRQSMIEAAKTKGDRYAVAINTAKWKAADAFCKLYDNMTFKILTEQQIYRNTGRK